jgi:hypothetical protein
MPIARDVVINPVRHCWSLIELPGWWQQPDARHRRHDQCEDDQDPEDDGGLRRHGSHSAVALRDDDSGVTSPRFSGTALHLPRLEDLDGLDIRFLAPAAGLSFGRRAASFPFGVAERRNACGPELARLLRGEVDHDAVRVDADCAAALVDLAAGIDGLKLDAHDYSVMKLPAALTDNGSGR